MIVAWSGPRMVRAHAALEWTRHHASKTPDPSGQHARGVTRWALRTLTEAAPHPWGADACQMALEFAGRQESNNPAAALAVYESVRAGLEQTASSRWRGLGLSIPLAQAREREQALRERSEVQP